MPNYHAAIFTTSFATPVFVYDSAGARIQVQPRSVGRTVETVYNCFSAKWRIPESNITVNQNATASALLSALGNYQAVGSDDVIFVYMNLFAWTKIIRQNFGVDTFRTGIVVCADYRDSNPNDLTMGSISGGIESRAFRAAIRRIVANSRRKVVVMLDFKESTMVMDEKYTADCAGITTRLNAPRPITYALNEPLESELVNGRIVYMCPYSNTEAWDSQNPVGATPFARTLMSWSYELGGVSGYNTYMRNLLDTRYLQSVRNEYAAGRASCWYESWVCWMQQLFFHYTANVQSPNTFPFLPAMNVQLGMPNPVPIAQGESPPFPPPPLFWSYIYRFRSFIFRPFSLIVAAWTADTLGPGVPSALIGKENW